MIRICAFVALLALVFASVTSAADLVKIAPERSFSRYATVESKQMRIHWNPKIAEHLPEAVDFLQGQRAGLWSNALDGPGERNEQVLALQWKESIDTLGFELQLKFASNDTHWFINQVVVQAGNTVATGLYAPAHSNSYKAGYRGHVLAARKGYPFECHYLELPLTVVDFLSCGSANSSSDPTIDLRSEIGIGEVLGVWIMEDFLISGWEGGPELKLVNRLEVEPCGLRHCGIQAMPHPASVQDLLTLNMQEMLKAPERTLETEQPEWYRWVQQLSWLPAMERVCGTQKEVDGMKHSHTFSASSPVLDTQGWSTIGFKMVTLLTMLVIWL